jgi:hypothetical protein
MSRLLAAVTVVLATLLTLAAPGAAQTFPERGRSPVVDQAGLLRPEQVLDLTSKSEALFAQTGRQFVVATVKSLEGRNIEDYGYRLGRHWQIGDEQKDDGVILLVAPQREEGQDRDRLWRARVPDRRDVERHHPQRYPAQVPRGRLRRRDRGGRQRDHQADELAGGRGAAERPAGRAGPAQAAAGQPRNHSDSLLDDRHPICPAFHGPPRRRPALPLAARQRRHQPLGDPVGPQ